MSVLVLVVDDEPDVEALFRQQFRRDLRAERFVMDFASSAPDALARVGSTTEHSLILILSDINMPGMSGIELLKSIRKDHPHAPPQVMMITAYGDSNNHDQAMQLGADDFLTKPVNFIELKEKLLKTL